MFVLLLFVACVARRSAIRTDVILGQGLAGSTSRFVCLSGLLTCFGKLTAQLYGHTRNLAEPEVRERIGEISVKEAGYINETRDASLLEGLYEGYTVCSVVPEVYDEDSENDRFCTGLFGVVYLRRKEMRFNCVGKRRYGR